MDIKSILSFLIIAILLHCAKARSLHKRAAFYIANETACVVDNIVYYNGNPIPTDDPCEICECRPPGFACVLRECEVKQGCRAVRRVGHCCPDYVCGCEHNGQMYRDEEEIRDSQNPCYICHCQGSAIACAFVDCFFRVDCAPNYVQGECCPQYNNCPPIDSSSNETYTRNSINKEEIPIILSTLRPLDNPTTVIPKTESPPDLSIIDNKLKEEGKDVTFFTTVSDQSNQTEPPKDESNSVEKTISESVSKLDPSSLFYIPKEHTEAKTAEVVVATSESFVEAKPFESTTETEPVKIVATSVSTEETSEVEKQEVNVVIIKEEVGMPEATSIVNEVNDVKIETENPADVKVYAPSIIQEEKENLEIAGKETIPEEKPTTNLPLKSDLVTDNEITTKSYATEILQTTVTEKVMSSEKTSDSLPTTTIIPVPVALHKTEVLQDANTPKDVEKTDFVAISPPVTEVPSLLDDFVGTVTERKHNEDITDTIDTEKTGGITEAVAVEELVVPSTELPQVIDEIKRDSSLPEFNTLDDLSKTEVIPQIDDIILKPEDTKLETVPEATSSSQLDDDKRKQQTYTSSKLNTEVISTTTLALEMAPKEKEFIPTNVPELVEVKNPTTKTESSTFFTSTSVEFVSPKVEADSSSTD